MTRSTYLFRHIKIRQTISFRMHTKHAHGPSDARQIRPRARSDGVWVGTRVRVSDRGFARAFQSVWLSPPDLKITSNIHQDLVATLYPIGPLTVWHVYNIRCVGVVTFQFCTPHKSFPVFFGFFVFLPVNFDPLNSPEPTRKTQLSRTTSGCSWTIQRSYQ